MVVDVIAQKVSLNSFNVVLFCSPALDRLCYAAVFDEADTPTDVPDAFRYFCPGIE